VSLAQSARQIFSRQTHDAGRAIDRLGIDPSHVVLDLGCGDGHHSRAIAWRKPALAVDLDVSLEQLRGLARQISKNGLRSYVCGDALALPFREECFDRVVCSLVFYLLPLERALQELYRLMKREGRAYLRVPMLATGRAREILNPRVGIRGRLYVASHVFNGLLYSMAGRQIRSPFVRRDRWACYVPRRRFVQAVRRAGFRIETLKIDYPKPQTPSIEAWVVKD
jgi:SAM-dependent methyltransferase